ncbi:MAG: hypothetical protein ACN2B6_08555 [Rickettsiales bacterium]
MWSQNSRRVIPLFLLLSLCACGFKPMYGKQGNNNFSGVLVEASSETRKVARQLQFDLEDKLNPSGRVPANPTYRLVASVRSTTSSIGVARDGTVSRYNINLISDYTLYKIGQKEPVTSGQLRHVSSYNNLVNQYYSTYVSEQDAMKRGLTGLAELYRQRLSSYLAKDAS